ncbi:substrate-binding domain-containing protein [Parvularcula dongshanensis]|uniref:DNA-binding LacI/PurR family transcriptional regulator n=1 Tax=Parvularcula dongshanensis TaxID=1173995 RepID=A0A840I8G4_9PROT|nr:DNA-binding LacI/PurR family transcriptional regulator [Parvularcula dongshanensis]
MTIYDLAEQLGVAPSTISRALAGSTRVSQETRDRIVKAAAAANYSVNTSARHLRQGRTNTVEVVFPLAASKQQRMTDPFYLDMLAVVADALSERNYDFLFVDRLPWDDHVRTRHHRVDGMIVIGQGSDQEALREFTRTYKKVVVWGARVPGDEHVTVGTDNVLGGKMAAAHLLGLGRRKIAFIGDPIEPEMEQRRQGFMLAHEEAGRPVDPKLLFRSPFDSHRAKIATRSFVASGREFDAVVCGSDVIALHMIDALTSAGRRVPEDIAVVGYDDISLASAFGQSLTTVSQQIPVGGRLMVDLLFSVLEGGEVQPAVIPPELQVRKSCGAQLGRFQK